MNVTLLTRESSIKDMENFAVNAALTCHGNTDKQVVNESLLTRIIKLGHESILEHIYLTYRIESISRALLQELARHRHITLSVESTRHTLKKYLDCGKIESFFEVVPAKFHGALQDCIYTLQSLSTLSSDELKYYLPECWPTNLIMTSNSVKSDSHVLDAQLRAIDVERAKILQHMLDAPAAPLSEESRAVIQHEMFKIVTGEQCISMLPAVIDKYYSATELGEIFGVSSKKIGRIAKANGLKTEEGEPSQFGQWRLSKSPYSAHQCSMFAYNSNALEWFKAHSDLLN